MKALQRNNKNSGSHVLKLMGEINTKKETKDSLESLKEWQCGVGN